jgi:MoaA/NifB/PqqE/SkfB family radical SAM enzyme
MEPVSLKEINFFTTYKCNSRCLNCLIWKGSAADSGKKELDLEKLQKLFSDPLFIQCPNIGFAGGEPTISSFFWNLLDMLPEDKRVTITTNGLNNKKLIDFLSRSRNRKRFLIQISLDGIEEVNDRVRGVKGAYQKTIALLEKLQELEVERLISFTINRLNYHQLMDCYKLANYYGAEFSTRLAHCGGAYLNNQNKDLYEFGSEELDALDRSLQYIIFQELEKSTHIPAKLIFIKKITDYYRGIQKDLPCKALETGMVIDLYGDVFPNCPVLMKPIGSLQKERLSEIWKGEKALKVREVIDAFKCGGCWNDCQVITNIDMDKNFLEEEYGKLKIAFLRGRSIPDVIDFNQEDSSLLLSGWYKPEGNSQFRFCWTEPEFSILIPKGTAALEIFAMLPSKGSNSDRLGIMEVMVGQEKINSLTLLDSEWKNYSISLPNVVTDLTPANFRLNRYFCPKEEGESEDERKLGLAINRIGFIRV